MGTKSEKREEFFWGVAAAVTLVLFFLLGFILFVAAV